MGFSENLKLIRHSKGMSQEQLAKKIGVYRQTIIEWENPEGKRPGFDSLVWLREALGVSWNKLMAGEEPKKELNPQWEKVAPTAKALLEFGKSVSKIVNATVGVSQKGQDE